MCPQLRRRRKGKHMDFNEKEFGARMRELRLGRNLTQETLAEDLNISWDHLCRIERGNRSCSLHLAIDIANYFGVGLDFLVFGSSHNQADMQAQLLEMSEKLKSMADKMS